MIKDTRSPTIGVRTRPEVMDRVRTAFPAPTSAGSLRHAAECGTALLETATERLTHYLTPEETELLQRVLGCVHLNADDLCQRVANPAPLGTGWLPVTEDGTTTALAVEVAIELHQSSHYHDAKCDPDDLLAALAKLDAAETTALYWSLKHREEQIP